ncbi:MAG: ABC transporter substrate-binding protein [Deltaproteobacteria bacterium]|jgi:ABC-type Fe3+-hydroxamate transport system substrate-binding protein|nr:ABC transporter substrate-binding protein [Deltaproteobacteria bacterium]
MKKTTIVNFFQKDFLWIFPFLSLCLMTLSLYKDTPTYPPLTGRTITDAEGRKVVIPENFKGIIPIMNFHLSVFLEKTHSPEFLAKAGSPKSRHDYIFSPWRRDLMDWVFPMVLRDDSLWDFPSDLESILAYDQEGYIYLANFFYLGQIRHDDIHTRLGLNTISYYPRSTYPRRPTSEEIEESTQIMATVLNDLIGQKDMAEVYMADYWKDLDDLAFELDLKSLESHPRVLHVFSSATDWTYVSFSGNHNERLGLNDSSKGRRALGREQDAERILFIDPDIIFTNDAIKFIKDPRWQGLKAVKEQTVYSGPRFNPWENDSNFYPLSLRYTAEAVYPERMAPKLRNMLREKFEKNYGYLLKNYEIDYILNLKDMSHSPFLIKRFGHIDDSNINEPIMSNSDARN